MHDIVCVCQKHFMSGALLEQGTCCKHYANAKKCVPLTGAREANSGEQAGLLSSCVWS